MNFLFPEHLVVQNQRKVERDRLFILRERMVAPGSGFSSLLNGLGVWMIAKGRELHERHSLGGQTRPSDLLQDVSIIFRTETLL